MAEIYVNTNSPIKHRVFWKGKITEADELPTVEVFDVTRDPAIYPLIDPETAIATLTTEKSEVDNGTYELFLPLYITARNRELDLVWSYEVDGNIVFKRHTVFVVTPYADIPEAIDALGLNTDDGDPNSKSYAELQAAEKYARKVIEGYTGQRFYLYDDVSVVYGNGANVLPLPFKLNTLHELYKDDILLVDTINEIDNWNYPVRVSESGFGLRVDTSGMLDNTVYTANGMVPPSINYAGNGAFSQKSVYRVQGKFGWDSVPDEVEVATIELMKDFFSKDKVWRNKYLHSVQSFDWHFEYNQESYRGTGNVYVDQILLPYVINQMVVI